MLPNDTILDQSTDFVDKSYAMVDYHVCVCVGLLNLLQRLCENLSVTSFRWSVYTRRVCERSKNWQLVFSQKRLNIINKMNFGQF